MFPRTAASHEIDQTFQTRVHWFDHPYPNANSIHGKYRKTIGIWCYAQQTTIWFRSNWKNCWKDNRMKWEIYQQQQQRGIKPGLRYTFVHKMYLHIGGRRLQLRFNVIVDSSKCQLNWELTFFSSSICAGFFSRPCCGAALNRHLHSEYT